MPVTLSAHIYSQVHILTELLTYTARRMVTDTDTITVDCADNLTLRKTLSPAFPEKGGVFFSPPTLHSI